MNAYLKKFKFDASFIERMDVTCRPAKLAPEMEMELKEFQKRKKDIVLLKKKDAMGRPAVLNDDFA